MTPGREQPSRREDTGAPREEADAPREGTDAPREDTDTPRQDTDAAREGTDAAREGTDAPREGTDAPRDSDAARAETSGPLGPTGWSEPARTAGGSSPDESGELPEGRLLSGRYRILESLGEGGMGSVHKAHDTELDRPIALKVIRPELARRPEILQRFKQEIILARQVTHQNVVRIFDLGDDDGLKFITMEYVEGRDLKSMINEGHEFSTDEAVKIVQQVCRALNAAHEAGVVHRDLKPQNIMLDEEGQARVMDFGIARSMDLTQVTRTGEMLGTPAYMSPEQAKGEPIDARSDIFSLGLVFYELLTGETPFEAETPVATLVKRTQERAAPPSKLRPDLPGYVDDVVVRCLETEPDLRYQNVRDVLIDLEARKGSRGHSTIARLPYVVRRTARSTRWALAALLVLVVGLAALTATGRLSLSSPFGADEAAETQPISLAVLPFENASGDRQLDWLQTSLPEWLRTEIGQSSRLVPVPSDRVLQIFSDLKLEPDSTLEDATLQRLASFSNAEILVSGQYSALGGRIRIDANVHDRRRDRTVPVRVEAADEEQLLRAVDELARSIRGNLDLSEAAIRDLEAASFTPSSSSVEALRFYDEGLQLERQGNYAEALERFEDAMARDPEFALAYSKAAQTRANLGYDTEAQRLSRQAVERSQDLPAYERLLISARHAWILRDYAKAIESYEQLLETAPEDPAIHFSLAGLHEDSGAYDQAREHLGTVLRHDPKWVDALFALGRVEIRAGNPAEAIDPLTRALNVTVQLGNEEGRARILNAIGIAYKNQGMVQEALANYRQALEIRRRLDDQPGVAATLNEIGQVHAQSGNLDQALASYEESLELRRQIGDRRGVGNTLLELGNFYADRGDHDQALARYKESLQIHRDLGNPEYEALCLNNIGTIYLDQGNFSDALTNFNLALALRRQLGVDVDVGETLFNLGETTSRLGQFDRALDHYLEALDQWRDAGYAIGIAAARNGMGTIFGYQGRLQAALESQREALTALEGTEDSYWRFQVTAGHASALVEMGRFDEAQQVLGDAAALSEELRNPSFEARIVDLQGDIRYHRGDLAGAEELYRRALQQAETGADQAVLLEARLDTAKVAVGRGRPGEARETLGTLVQEADSQGLDYLAAEASVYLAEALLEAREYEPARQRLEETLARSERLGLRILRARCHHLLGLVDRATGEEAAAARHARQAQGLVEELRREAGDDPLNRSDLARIVAETTATSG